MTKQLALGLSALLGAVSLAAGTATAARASDGGIAAGSFAITADAFTPLRSTDGSTLFREQATLVYSGDVTGTAVDTDLLLVRADGSFGAVGVEVCNACTVAGRTGNFTAVFTYSGSGSDYTGHLMITGGSGGLGRLHGGGTFAGDAAGNTYAYRFEP